MFNKKSRIEMTEDEYVKKIKTNQIIGGIIFWALMIVLVVFIFFLK